MRNRKVEHSLLLIFNNMTLIRSKADNGKAGTCIGKEFKRHCIGEQGIHRRSPVMEDALLMQIFSLLTTSENADNGVKKGVNKDHRNGHARGWLWRSRDSVAAWTQEMIE